MTPENTIAALEPSMHSLSMHDHPCSIYENTIGLKKQFVPFLRSGLLLGEKCVYFIDENDAKFVVAAMKEGGFNLKPYQFSGQFEIIHTKDAHLHGDHFSEEKMLAYWNSSIDAAKETGFKGLRAAVEMTWALSGKPGCEILAPYESRLTKLMQEKDASVICMYSRRKFSAEKIKAVIQAHPIVVSEDLVLENPACPPPEKYVEGCTDMDVQITLDNLQLIKDLKQAQSKIDARIRDAQIFKLLVASVKDYAIFMLDPMGYIVTWNEGAQRAKGYTADEIIGQHFSIFYTSDAKSREHPQRELDIAREKGHYEEEGWRVRKDGSLFWANVVITALHEEGELVGFAKVTRDLTERKNAEIIREKAFQELALVNDEMQHLARVISHELQGPTLRITSYSRLLAARYKGKLGADADEFLAHITTGATLTAKLVDDLWTYARVTQADQRHLPVSTASLLQDAKEELNSLIETRSAQVIIETPENFPTLHASKEQLLWAFKEIITNAMKHNKDSGFPKIKISVKPEKTGWTFSFKDNGPGVDKFLAHQVFAMYQKIDGKPDQSGTGIGLPICKKIIETQHKGKIGYESTEGKGAAFYVWLPAATD